MLDEALGNDLRIRLRIVRKHSIAVGAKRRDNPRPAHEVHDRPPWLELFFEDFREKAGYHSGLGAHVPKGAVKTPRTFFPRLLEGKL